MFTLWVTPNLDSLWSLNRASFPTQTGMEEIPLGPIATWTLNDQTADPTFESRSCSDVHPHPQILPPHRFCLFVYLFVSFPSIRDAGILSIHLTNGQIHIPKLKGGKIDVAFLQETDVYLEKHKKVK